jgi:RHS repeat-associated protein
MAGADGSAGEAGGSGEKAGKFLVSAPRLELPKGGGAIRGMGEKFSANPASGTGSMSVTLEVSGARDGFQPDLMLSYDSGAGNGPFGFGWNLNVASITRKTDKGLPRYVDAEESDVFMLAGADDLMPRMRSDAPGDFDELPPRFGPDGRRYRVRRYRPRVDEEFARIERWTEVDTVAPPNQCWRVITRENVTAWYGLTDNSRLTDPNDPRRTFSWLVCYSHDDKGNAIVYDYVAEDSRGVDLRCANERNRTDLSRGAQRYLKRIRFGNRRPNRSAADRPLPFADVSVSPNAPAGAGAVGWLFSLVFEFDGEQHLSAPQRDAAGRDFHAAALATPASAWSVRKDAFSSYRSGFELRTYRRCTRALMFHHFPDELGRDDYLVSATEFAYRYGVELGDGAVASYLQSVTERSFRIWQGADAHAGEYFTRAMPALEFEYSEARLVDVARDVDAESLRNLPSGAEASFQWVDLDGDGLSGLLTEQGDAWYFKRNLSAANIETVDGRRVARPAFAAAGVVQTQPAARLASGGTQLLDLAGDGSLDVVDFQGLVPGFYERNDGGWHSQRQFSRLPQIDWRDRNLRFIDLDGDGHADILMTENEVMRWYPSLAEEGFDAARYAPLPLNDEEGPRVLFSDEEHTVLLADLSGDGLTDIVRVRNGDVCYWPNLGHGRFGRKVSMDHAPVFDAPEQFDARRVQFADVDGSGTSDIVYFSSAGATLYRNLCGNGWALADVIRSCPPTNTLSSAAVVDLLCNGTACLVWSSTLPGERERAMRYVDLMGGQKPHLMVRSVNNLGAETRVEYMSSTYFYLDDERRGDPWLTRLPFPVHLVSRVTTEDRVSRNRFTTRYAYHHGFFDGVERDFHGFGMVEQWDTESIEALTEASAADTLDNITEASHVAPVHTKSWYHTGVYLGRGRISNYFAAFSSPGSQSQYFREPGLTEAEALARLLPDTEVPPGLTTDEEREACRALKGMLLRQEVYADDGSAKAPIPYTVLEQNFAVRCVQRRGANLNGVFSTYPLESLAYHYERVAADPRVQHALTLEVDDFDNVIKQASVCYGRRQPDAALTLPADRERQTQTLITYTETDSTDPVDAGSEDEYRAPLPAEVRTYELTGYAPTPASDRFTPSHFVAPDNTDPRGFRRLHLRDGERQYEEGPRAGRQRRLIECDRTLYRRNDLDGFLPLGQLESHAFAGEAYQLVYTPGLITQVFGTRLPDPVDVLGGKAGGRGGYVDLDRDGRWWQPSGRQFLSPNASDDAVAEFTYARQHFFSALRYRDPFHADSRSTEMRVVYDRYDLLPRESIDALGNRVTHGERRPDGEPDPAVTGLDYRVLEPNLITDANGNRTAAAFDVFGLVVGTAAMGKRGENAGDTLASFEPDLDEATALAFLTNPLADPAPLLGGASTRVVHDVFAWQRTQALPEPVAVMSHTIARETHASEPGGAQTRVQHHIAYSDGFGREIQKKTLAEPGRVPLRDANGRILLDTEGRPTLSAQSTTRWTCTGWTVLNNKGKPVREFEPFFTDQARFEFGVRLGVSPILFYDPVGRVVATLHPNHTYEKVTFDAWRQRTFDRNDTVASVAGPIGDPRTDADIAGLVARYFASLPAVTAANWRTWYEQRVNGALGPHEQSAAEEAAVHSSTPTTQHFDSLGRPFLTSVHNRFRREDSSIAEEFHSARVELDIEGNKRVARDAIVQSGDALGRVALICQYDLIGRQIERRSMDGGTRWTLEDVAGDNIRSWDSRGHAFVTTYDELHRPLEYRVRGTTADSDPRTLGRDCIVDRYEYGEGHSQALALNARTRVLRHYDSAGVVVNFAANPRTDVLEGYDFKGNLLRSTRTFTASYRDLADWSQSPALDMRTYPSSTRYDAINRPVQSISPRPSDAGRAFSITQTEYNEAGLVESMHVWLDQTVEPAGSLDAVANPPSGVGIDNVDYDARGQRTRVDYRNGVSTFYQYDPLTQLLSDLYSRRGAGFTADCENPKPLPATIAAPDAPPPQGRACGLQNLHYHYDPCANITAISDAAQQALFFDNLRVDSHKTFRYDSLYRLIEATGREHLGQAGGAPIAFAAQDEARSRSVVPGAGGRFSPGDGQALGRYSEHYRYDAAGNLVELRHRSTDAARPGWTRSFSFDHASLTEPAKFGNRLSSTRLDGNASLPEDYLYDAHGNVRRAPHLGGSSPDSNLQWDYEDRLLSANLGGGGVTFYQYDSEGERVRKVWEKSATLREERRYVDETDFFIRTRGGEILERDTLQVLDDKRLVGLVESRRVDTDGSDGAPGRVIRMQLSEHLGSCSLEIDENAQIFSYEEYAPFGSTTYQAVRNRLETPKRYRFTGKERDEETGFYYHQERYYAPWLGRWMSCDPGGLVDGANTYWYARANPVKLSDPTGLAASDQRLGAGLEKASRAHQDAANEVRKAKSTPQRKFDKVPVKYQKGIGGKRKTIPDERRAAPGKRKAKLLVDQKARHVDSKRNRSAAKRKADIRQNLDQVKDQLKKAKAAGEVTKDAKGKAMRVLHDSDKGKSSAKRLEKWRKEAREVRTAWVNEAKGSAQKALRSSVDVVTTTRDKLSKATAALKASLAKHAPSPKTTEKLLKAGGKLAKAGKHLVKPVVGLLVLVGFAGTANAATNSVTSAAEGDYGTAAAEGGSAVADVVESTPTPVGAVIGAGRAGYAVGEAINELLSDETKDAIGGTINEIVNEGGWREIYKHPFGIGL